MRAFFRGFFGAFRDADMEAICEFAAATVAIASLIAVVTFVFATCFK